MRTWTLADAEDGLGEVARRALAHQPQRITLGEDAVVVVSADDFAVMSFARDLIEFIQGAVHSRRSDRDDRAMDLQHWDVGRDTEAP